MKFIVTKTLSQKSYSIKGENCIKGQEVFALDIELSSQNYSENELENNISVTAKVEDVYFSILNIPGSELQREIILSQVQST